MTAADFGLRMARLIDQSASCFADPDSVPEDPAMKMEITWRDVHAARRLLATLSPEETGE